MYKNSAYLIFVYILPNNLVNSSSACIEDKDFVRGDGALLLTPGESQLCLKLVEIIDDNIIEADETFSIEFSFIVSSAFPAIPSIISSVTIIDNDMGMYVARTVLLFPLFHSYLFLPHSSHLLSLPHSHLCISLFSFLPPLSTSLPPPSLSHYPLSLPPLLQS